MAAASVTVGWVGLNPTTTLSGGENVDKLQNLMKLPRGTKWHTLLFIHDKAKNCPFPKNLACAIAASRIKATNTYIIRPWDAYSLLHRIFDPSSAIPPTTYSNRSESHGRARILICSHPAKARLK